MHYVHGIISIDHGIHNSYLYPLLDSYLGVRRQPRALSTESRVGNEGNEELEASWEIEL